MKQNRASSREPLCAPLLRQNPPGSTQPPTLNSVVMFPGLLQSVTVSHSFIFRDLDILEELLVTYFVERSSIWICLRFPNDWVEVMHFWQESRRTVPFSVPPISWYTMSSHLIDHLMKVASSWPAIKLVFFLLWEDLVGVHWACEHNISCFSSCFCPLHLALRIPIFNSYSVVEDFLFTSCLLALIGILP